MIRFFYPSNILVLAFLAATLLSSVCYAETRYALVIGNGKYSMGELTSPMLDADAMEKILVGLNYKVVAKKNLTRDQLYKEISKFGELLKKAGSTGFFYYSGHGMQVNGTNYMIPVDLEIVTEHDIEEHGVRIDSVISRMNTGKSNPNIIVLDACRNNPFEKRFKNVAAGLAEMKHTPPGMLVAFAAAPGRVARQSPNRLSPYTAELLNQLARANMSLIPLFQAVQDGVWKATGGDQEPRIEISPNLRDIVLNGEQASIPGSDSVVETTNEDRKETLATSKSEKSREFAEVLDAFYEEAAERGNNTPNNLGVMDAESKREFRDGAKVDLNRWRIKDNLIVDLKTGLMWTRDDLKIISGQFAKNWDDTMRWVERMNATNYAGHSDWKLASIAEYRTIYGAPHRQLFQSSGADYYWARNEINKYVASYFSFKDGAAVSGDKGGTMNLRTYQLFQFSGRLVRATK